MSPPKKSPKSIVIGITGTPGTGKTYWAKVIQPILTANIVSDNDVARRSGAGSYDSSSNEVEVDITALRKILIRKIKNTHHSLIIEGHLLCEMSLPLNGLIILTCPVPILQKRLRKRKYSDVKILDNCFCEETHYCLKKAKKNYPHIPKWKGSTHRAKKVIRAELLEWIRRIH
ncbi:MAG: AAA family ATPase [Candidatus Diapherotrites archaeon]